jgi:hypothetical protein
MPGRATKVERGALMSLPNPAGFDDPVGPAEPADQPAEPQARLGEALPRTSFAERYRGTEWSGSPAPAEPTDAAARRRPPGWLVMLGGFALMVVGLAGGVYLALGAGRPGGVSGFVHMTAPPTALIFTAPPTETPVGGSTPTPGPTQPPWVTDPLHPAGLFITNMTAPDVSYHLEISLYMTADSQQATMAEVADVAGGNYSFALTMTSPTKTTRVAGIYKDGYYYAKLDDWPWVQRATSVPTGGVLGNLGPSTWAGLQYVGPESVDGQLYHHLRLPITGWPGAADSMVFDISQAPPVFNLDVWVDDKGRPHSASVQAELTLIDGGRAMNVTMDADYTFSKFGKKVTVQAPTSFRRG